MFKNQIKSFVFVISFLSLGQGIRRNISCEIFNNDHVNIVHIRATGPTDAVHYLWSTFNVPSVVILRTTKETELDIDASKVATFDPGAIKLSKDPLVSTGFSFSELWELSYRTSTDDIKDVQSTDSLDLMSFTWSNITNKTLSCSETYASVNLKANSTSELFSKNGYLSFQFAVSANEEKSNDFPHLYFTSNSTQINIVLDNLFTNASRARYGFEMKLFSKPLKACSSANCQIVKTNSISDEFSPGVFSDVDLHPPCSEKSENGSFVRWRPVVHTSQITSVANSSDATLMKSDCGNISIGPLQSIAELYFSGVEGALVNALNITFGTKGDGFYSKTEYSSWTLMVGTGTPVDANLSLTVIIFAIFGIAIFLLFMFPWIIFILVRRFRKKDDNSPLIDNIVN